MFLFINISVHFSKSGKKHPLILGKMPKNLLRTNPMTRTRFAYKLSTTKNCTIAKTDCILIMFTYLVLSS